MTKSEEKKIISSWEIIYCGFDGFDGMVVNEI